MAWNTPTSTTTNQQVTHTFWNQQIPDNFNAGFPDGVDANSWSPTLSALTTAPTVASTDGAECVIGAIQYAWGRFVGITNTGSGDYYVTIPSTASGVTANSSPSTDMGQVVGRASAYSANNAQFYPVGYAALRTTTTVWLGSDNDWPWDDSASPLTSGWASDSQIGLFVCYPISS